MSGEEGRGWILVVVAMLALSVGGTVAYLLAPYDPSPNERADTGTPGTVPAEHRIIALRDDGALVLLDDRTGELSEIVTPDTAGDISVLETTAGKQAAYVVRSERDTIDLIRIRTGGATEHTSGRAATIGPIAFPQLDRVVPRPDAEQMAFVSDIDGRVTLVVENLTTGSRQLIAPTEAFDPRDVDDLALSPFHNRLFGIVENGRAAFRLDTDVVETLDQATRSAVGADVERYVDATPFQDSVAVIAERPDGSTDVVALDRETLEPAAVLHDAPPGAAPLRMIDADEKATSFLLVRGDGELLRFTPASDDEPRPLAQGVVLAVW